MSLADHVASMFPARLQDARMSQGTTQEELAGVTGLQASAISHFECGRRLPSVRNLLLLCEALEVSADWLLGGGA